MTVLDVSDAIQSAMKSLSLVGSYDVRWDGSRSTGWVGRPGDGEDVAVTVSVAKLPPMKTSA
ncbi:hypothetical protein ASE90_01710 [Sphingomonas sp. Leaf67]|uniref:hypothetical protein n=1 Tax=Sphingomonas sp. Leaf67 TaxID=1736230 RepID=UPI0006F56AC6|nr:hypothetical protein [Sphingomonas sp. Leaf67]KQN91547.1 hypothetical protein ASE90_01710 [Sphingomonas sp. Leaf67]